jgi:hypothetical protein
MSVSSVGGAASLPVPLSPQTYSPGTAVSTSPTAAGAYPGTTFPGSARPAGSSGSSGPPGSDTSAGSAGTAASAGTAILPGSAGSVPGELRLPGQHPDKNVPATPRKEVPKPPPLPPLKGLTVAEIRAMLGAAILPGAGDAARQTAASAQQSASLQAAVSRYA